MNPGKITNTEKIVDTGEDGKGAVPTLNPVSDKIIDTGEDADLRLHPGKDIIDTATLQRLSTLTEQKAIITEQKALITAMLTEED